VAKPKGFPVNRIPFVAALLVALPAATPAQTVADLRARAERRDAAAQKELADSLFARKDEANGIIWLRKSAEAGHAKAQADLGWRYLLGSGVPKDLGQARVWYRKAAANGLVMASALLCNSYENPMEVMKGTDPLDSWPLPPVTGPKRDLAELLDSCRKGATTGSTMATRVLGVLYARGIGDIKPDYEQAYFWLRVRGGPRDLRRKLPDVLTPEKRAEIEARARAWKTYYPLRPELTGITQLALVTILGVCTGRPCAQLPHNPHL
jgi:hypothetical protein